jgi:hypothetical protein
VCLVLSVYLGVFAFSEGKIDDPYGEFLIKENKDTGKDDMGHDFNAKYWESGNE